MGAGFTPAPSFVLLRPVQWSDSSSCFRRAEQCSALRHSIRRGLMGGGRREEASKGWSGGSEGCQTCSFISDDQVKAS